MRFARHPTAVRGNHTVRRQVDRDYRAAKGNLFDDDNAGQPPDESVAEFLKGWSRRLLTLKMD